MCAQCAGRTSPSKANSLLTSYPTVIAASMPVQLKNVANVLKTWVTEIGMSRNIPAHGCIAQTVLIIKKSLKGTWNLTGQSTVKLSAIFVKSAVRGLCTTPRKCDM